MNHPSLSLSLSLSGGVRRASQARGAAITLADAHAITAAMGSTNGSAAVDRRTYDDPCATTECRAEPSPSSSSSSSLLVSAQPSADAGAGLPGILIGLVVLGWMATSITILVTNKFIIPQFMFPMSLTAMQVLRRDGDDALKLRRAQTRQRESFWHICLQLLLLTFFCYCYFLPDADMHVVIQRRGSDTRPLPVDRSPEKRLAWAADRRACNRVYAVDCRGAGGNGWIKAQPEGCCLFAQSVGWLMCECMDCQALAFISLGYDQMIGSTTPIWVAVLSLVMTG